MPDTAAVRDVMSTDVVVFSPEETLAHAVRRLLERGVNGGPVVDPAGKVVGVLTAADLIVQEAELPVPTVINILGAMIQIPHRRLEFEDQVRKTFGSTVGELMTAEPIVCRPDDSVEEAATVMHEHDLSRLPVVDEHGHLQGLLTRRDLLKHLLESFGDEDG